ncbi:TRAP transporter small permease [Salinicoccus halitifaciens]|uniref:TRAP-type C4-dicarboxylate transport system permease small subunit n=1 Tax=Salinicoccus halitifaciens TaxID=1073415 RepID=A0ABV2ECB6_9STAP|nr:TRAP transporter small permease [Salinicoccus halitifaciens]MCD2138768.1 TRAP transporter small permease [Salinicoccus halitifaciens]
MKLRKIIAGFLTVVVIIIMTLLTGTVLLQVITRAVGYSMPGTEEFSRLMIVWLTFLGSSLAFYEKMHLAVTFFVRRFKEERRKYLQAAVNILIVVFYLIVIYYGFKLSMTAMGSTSSTLQIPMTAFYSAIPVSGIFAIFFIVTDIFENPVENEEGAAL